MAEQNSPRKKGLSPAEWKRVEDPEAASVFVDATTRRFIQPFIWRERRITDVAVELGVSKNAVLYRVRQFQRLGLVEVTSVEARAGRSIKYYRATSRGFFVPFTHTSAESVPDLYEQTIDSRGVIEALTHAWSRLSEDARWFGLYTSGDEGGVRSHMVLPRPPDDSMGSPEAFTEWLLADDSPAIWDNAFPLRLSNEDAKALQRDLRALELKYKPRRLEEGGAAYVLRTTLAPI